MHLPFSTWSILPMTSHFYLLVLSSLTVSSPLGLDEVFFSPQDQTAREGDTVFFPCVSGESSPPASISWLKDGKPVTRGRQIQGEYGGGNQRKTSGTLHLYNITLEDNGTYICITYNSLLNTSKQSKPAKLTVQGVPRRLQFIHGPDNITVAMGEEVSMRCAVGGFPVPMVHWFKDGCLLTNCSASFSLLNNGQLLTFRNVSKEHEGFYHCEAFNQNERIKSQMGFLLLADMDWIFIQQPLNLTVKKGDNVTVTCRPPDSRPPAQVSWFKNNQLLTPTAHVSVLPNGNLLFDRVQEHDSGSYFCRASNTHLQRFLTSRRAIVTVLAPPSVTLWPRMLTVPVGARVVLECQVSGHPLPSISWFKSSHSKQTGGRVIKGLTNATLYIQSARSYDEGVYVCHASNSLGDSQHSAVLKVAVSPIIVNFASQVSCRIGALAVLPCRAVGIVPIMYTWTKRGGNKHIAITPNEETYIDGEGSLHISNVHWSDEGEYYCMAKNRAGQHQKRSFLTVTVEEHPADRVVLSANTSTSQNMAVLPGSVAEQHLQTTPPQHFQTQHKETPCLSSQCWGPTQSFNGSGTTPASFHLLPLGINPSQYFVTQMPPPIFPPPPHPDFRSSSPENQLPAPSHPSYTKYLPFLSQPKSAIPEHTAGPTQTIETLSQDYNPQIAEGHLYRSLPEVSVSTSYSFTETGSHSVTQTSLVPLSPTLQVETHKVVTKLILPKIYNETISTPIPQTRMEPPGNPMHLKNQPSPTNSERSSQTYTHTYSYLSSTLSTSKEIQTYAEPTPTSSTSTVSTPLQIQPPLVPTQQPHWDLLSHTDSSSLNRLTSHPIYLQPTTFSNTHPVNQTYSASTLDTAFHVVNISQQLNSSEREQSMESTLAFNGTEKNTSQSPRVTQQVPSWLPVLEKHDIPIVVGVGVSLAFIFITVTFYSVVQKNEPAPTNRAAQRNVGVPTRHMGRRAAGRTYENRAFEDDDCVAVIEQSPNTSDTRARPPGPSLVTVQLEPSYEDQQGDTPPSLDLHSVTVETYPEPILDTKIDHCLEEESGLSLSQPSIQLQCAEDWPSSGDDNHDPYQDTLPPPSPLPSPSPSPSSSSKHDEGLRSLLTLQSAELCAAPIHHSLSISHGQPPLLLSHHVSLGPTNVAVDVQFHSVSPLSISVQSSTHINTSSVFTAPLANSQESAHSK